MVTYQAQIHRGEVRSRRRNYVTLDGRMHTGIVWNGYLDVLSSSGAVPDYDYADVLIISTRDKTNLYENGDNNFENALNNPEYLIMTFNFQIHDAIDDSLLTLSYAWAEEEVII